MLWYYLFLRNKKHKLLSHHKCICITEQLFDGTHHHPLLLKQLFRYTNSVVVVWHQLIFFISLMFNHITVVKMCLYLCLQACVVLVVLVYSAQAANILAMFLVPSYSHQMPLLRLSKALAARGHNLTVITANPSEVSCV